MPNLLNRANTIAIVPIFLNSFRFHHILRAEGVSMQRRTHLVLDSPSTLIPGRDFCLFLYRNGDLL